MTNSTDYDYQAWIGRTAIDSEGAKIGKIGQIYLNDQTGQPEWVTVHTGLFGGKENFAPMYGATNDGDDMKLAVTKDLVKDAPGVEADGHIEESETDALYTHYQGHLGAGAGGDAVYDHDAVEHAHDHAKHTTEGRADLAGQEGVVGRDTSGPTTDTAMTRSEEQLHVGTQSVETGRARLRKYVVTEQVTTTVPVSHEEVRVVREPITAENRGDALSGAELSEEEHEVTLHAEQPVVSKETVPVERVRLDTETVTGEQQVNESVSKEQIEQVDVDGTVTGRQVDPDAKR